MVELSLEQNEQIIRDGIQSFREVGEALLRIRDGGPNAEGQFQQLGYPTFEEYLRDRWGFQRTWADQQIAASKVVATIEAQTADRGQTLPEWGTRPQTENAARPLFKVLLNKGEPGVAKVWTHAVKNHEGDRPITEPEVKKAAREVFPGLYLPSTESAQDKLVKALDSYQSQAEALYHYIRGNRSRAYEDELKQRLRAEAKRLESQAKILRALASGVKLPSSDEMRDAWGLDV